MKYAVVVPWHRGDVLRDFKQAWGIEKVLPEFLFLQQDSNKEGCARTKNKGIRRALDSGADVVVVLDSDCYPATPVMGQPEYPANLEDFVAAHIKALKPQKVRAVYPTCIPHPRGMPYRNEHVIRPVAASIGLWTNHLDLDAVSALVLGERVQAEQYARFPFYHYMFPFCGMNFAFTKEWADCAILINVPRWDDIWMGWIWEKVAYEKGYCFNLAGPMVNHARQSDVWKNFEDESKYLKVNEDLWKAIYNAPTGLSAAGLREKFFARTPPVAESALAAQGPDPAFGAASADLA
jgi:Reversibly glycosylated polypeptide